MDEKIICAKLDEKSWQQYKELRLDGLKKEPLAFGGSYEDTIKKSSQDWKDMIKRNQIIGIFLNGNLVGTICFWFESGTKVNHICNIFGVYLDNRYRNKGLSTILMSKVISLIKENKSIRKIKLTVNVEQSSAIKLYQKFGFKIVGKLINELNINGNFYDELIMELHLK